MGAAITLTLTCFLAMLRSLLGDFQERCNPWAATLAAWIKGTSRIGLGSSIGLLIPSLPAKMTPL